jgi:hypothetical protein
MSTNSPASKLSYVIINNGDTDHPLEQGETWKFIVAVDDTFDAYNQMSKCQLQAAQFGHSIMNVYLDGLPFNPRGWYTDEVNHDKIEYDDDIKIDNLTDEIARRKEFEDKLSKPDNPTTEKNVLKQGTSKSGSSDTYTKSYLQDLGRRWGIDAEAGHLIEKGYAVTISGGGQYQCGANIDLHGMEKEKEKLTRSIQKHLA